MQRVVLVIDDDEHLRASISSALEAVGFKTVTAGFSQEGLSLAFIEPPDLVLCDLILPDAVGFETARALNEHPVTSSVPVILMTGYPYMRPSGVQSQWRVLTKPFAMSSMLDTVSKAIGFASGPAPKN
jgi:CheY-like chemotaxis protein